QSVGSDGATKPPALALALSRQLVLRRRLAGVAPCWCRRRCLLSSHAVAAVIGTRRRPAPMRGRDRIRFENFDFERMTRSNIVRVSRTAIAAGASGQSAKQVDLREELYEVSSPHRACLHEILVCVLREPSAHENVEHIMDVMLDGARRAPQLWGESARQIRVTAPIVIAAVQ